MKKNKIFLYSIIFLVIDIISKYIIDKSMDIFDSYSVIKNFFSITYVRNTGAAWSIMSDDRLFLIVISFTIIMCIIEYIIKSRPSKIIDIIAYSMILGGAFGNFFNRIFLGYVIDFLDFNLFGYNYPVFNLADTFIVIGIIFVLISSWRDKK